MRFESAWIFVWLALCALLSAAAAQERREDEPAADGPSYELTIRGVEGALRDLILQSIDLVRLQDRPSASVPALRARLDADLDAIEQILRSEAYYGYRIEHRVDAERSPTQVDIDIVTGPAYRLTSYAILYRDLPSDRAPVSHPNDIGVPLGEPARAEAIVEAQARLLRRLGERGYPFASVEERRVVVHHDAQIVSVALDVSAGPAAVFGDVAVRGNRRVEGGYIRRLANVRPGAVFSYAVVDEARRRLFESGLFESVDVSWPEEARDRSILPLAIAVREREVRTFAAGIYYSTAEGIGTDASWTHRNLFGRAERIELGFRLAEREQALYADYLDPHVGRLDQNLIGRADLRERETEAYHQRSASAAAGLERRLSRRWKASLSTGLEATEIRDPLFADQRYLILSLPAQLNYDGTDDLFDPSRGQRLTIDAVPNQATGDSQARFLLGSLGGSTYHEILPERDLVLAARARVATLLGAERDEIPASRRLYAGGGGSVRGYEFQTIGPLRAANRPLGGRGLFEFGVEARFRVYDDFGIVPFIDGGSVSADAWPTVENMQWAAGLGFRYYTAIGPLRLDVAVPLNRRPGTDDAYAFYISLGQAF